MIRPIPALATLLVFSGLSIATPALAEFQGRYLTSDTSQGFDAYYDTDLDVTWLADASYGGRMSWDYADNWVQTVRLGGYDDWRLPTFSDGSGDGSTGEFYQMWVVELGNNDDLQHPTYSYNSGPFENVQYYITSGGPTAAYWTDESVGDQAYAWQTFNASYIAQYKEGLYWGYSVWLVRDGDSGFAAPVPEAETWAMMLAGLGLLGFASRRR